jgi:hypothetical protein
VREQTQAGMWGLTQPSANFSLKGYSLTCRDPDFPNIANGVTVEFWFQVIAPFNDIGAGNLLSLQHTSGAVLNIGVNGAGAANQGQLYLGDPHGNTTLLSSVNYMTGTPPVTHVALTFTRTTWTAYIDGLRSASGSWATEPPSLFRVLAANGWAGTPDMAAFATSGSLLFFSGYMGHIAVFSRILSPERIMTHYQAGQAGMAGDSANDRIERLLQAAPYPGRRVILQDPGVLSTPCSSCQDIASQPASTSIQNVIACNVPGTLVISPPGAITWLSRAWVWSQPVKWVLGEDTGSGEIPYLGDVAIGYDPLRVVNDVQLTQLDNQDIVTPQDQVATEDAASQLQYGDQPYWVTGYLDNDLLSPQTAGPGLLDLANWIGGVNAKPGERVQAVTVEASTSTSATTGAAWTFLMTVSPGDMITVNRRPITAPGLLISVTGRVSQVTRTISCNAADGVKATAVLLVDIAAEQTPLTADDPVKGLLNGQNVQAW